MSSTLRLPSLFIERFRGIPTPSISVSSGALRSSRESMASAKPLCSMRYGSTPPGAMVVPWSS